MLEFLWGYKTTAMLDVWSFEHVLTGLSVGSGVLIHNHKSLGQIFAALKEGIIHPKRINFLKYKYDFIFLMMIAYIWETLEHYLETGIAGARVAHWFAGIEFWPNRLFFDPLMLIIGYLIVKKYPRLVWPARVLTLIWLIAHIFFFPDSMYLQKFI